jgi:hypothetical protein
MTVHYEVDHPVVVITSGAIQQPKLPGRLLHQ